MPPTSHQSNSAAARRGHGLSSSTQPAVVVAATATPLARIPTWHLCNQQRLQAVPLPLGGFARAWHACGSTRRDGVKAVGELEDIARLQSQD